MSSVIKVGGPLGGYRVVDLTTFLSGPFCTQILSDLGAEVVKVEAPGGDSSRAIPPHFVAGDSAYFHGTNRGKSSICVDLKTDAGLGIAKRLIEKADVVVENFRPGVSARIGLDPVAMCAARPDLIWASISGFGQDGPWKDRPAYDMIVQALSGVMSLTGEVGRPAMRLGVPAGDIVAGLYATIGISSALAERERTGMGRRIDVSMLDCQLALLSYQSAYALLTGATPEPQGAKHDSIPTYRSFRGGDGRELVVTANTERMWQGLCQVLGEDVLTTDVRFSTSGDRLKNKDALWLLLETAFLNKGAEEWVDLLQAAGVPAAIIRTVPEALDDARASGRGMIVKLEDTDGNAVEVVGNPIKLDRGHDAKPSFPPRLGHDAEAVLSDWLGIDREEIAVWRKDGVLREAQS